MYCGAKTSRILEQEEIKGGKQVLDAAALTILRRRQVQSCNFSSIDLDTKQKKLEENTSADMKHL